MNHIKTVTHYSKEDIKKLEEFWDRFDPDGSARRTMVRARKLGIGHLHKIPDEDEDEEEDDNGNT